MWVTTEICRDPSLLTKIRAELETLGCLDKATDFSVKKLLGLPRLQGVYAETLRLRVHVIISRESDREDLTLMNGYVQKKHSRSLNSSSKYGFRLLEHWQKQRASSGNILGRAFSELRQGFGFWPLSPGFCGPG